MKTIIMLTVFITIFGLVGAMDYEDEIAIQKDYCETSLNGKWVSENDNQYCEVPNVRTYAVR
ncbi:hypothetical protein L5B97_09620 [Avibacterium sp. 20-15]|uniref:hypothetical protein n=1 Tax=unclassified Avibacterium TaxID=2685287 RepID=UPI0020271A0D|nr:MULTISPECIES: hypothetical protein [unclassified Avibacterium]MCW9733713.1 hypothetical protein [Avibacterium sp. 20-15]URL03562.1 hypothetical protein L4F93_08310 [Avibacterium sp. 20-132]